MSLPRLTSNGVGASLRVALLCVAVPAGAQTASDCIQARQAEENTLHRKNEAELQKKEIDVENEYRKALLRCDTKRDAERTTCSTEAAKKRQADMLPILEARSDETARHDKALIDIANGDCVADARSGGAAPPPSNDGILGTGDRARLFKLAAEMNVVADELTDSGNPAAEFAKGLADWAGQTAQFLAQKPGVPLQQMAQGIVDYLTNDNAANHRALMEAAKQAVAEFQKNPARFLGQNLPNVLPGPEAALGKAGALRQIAQVEKAAGRIKGLAQTERAFTTAFQNTINEAERFGTGPAYNACFAKNACFPTALAEAEVFRTGGPLGDGTPVRVRGAYPLNGTDLVHSADQVRARLEPYGRGYAPRRIGTFNPEQLDAIWQGNPVPMNSPDQIRRILEREGAGSQGLVFTEMHPTPNHKPGDPLGHVFNAQNHDGTIRFVDHTTPGMDPLFTASRVKQWWYFPIQ